MAVPAEEEGRRVLIVAPYGRDAETLSGVLSGRGYHPQIYGDVTAMAAAIDPTAGLALVAEEALRGDVSALERVLQRQPVWSDIPIVLLAARPAARLQPRRGPGGEQHDGDVGPDRLALQHPFQGANVAAEGLFGDQRKACRGVDSGRHGGDVAVDLGVIASPGQHAGEGLGVPAVGGDDEDPPPFLLSRHGHGLPSRGHADRRIRACRS